MAWRSGYTILDRGGWGPTGFSGGYYGGLGNIGFSLRNVLDRQRRTFRNPEAVVFPSIPVPVGQPASEPPVELSDVAAAVISQLLYPTVGPQVSVPLESRPASAAVVPQTAPPAYAEVEVIDPEEAPDLTVFESAPGGVYETERAPTDWDEYYRQYVALNAPDEETDEVFDWLADATLLGQAGQSFGWWGGDDSAAAAPQATQAAMPATVTVNTRTGRITPCRRRRRRKLLTESDFNVLLRVATLPNKENVRIVLGKAIGRS